MEQQERYYDYMVRNMREADKKMNKENALSNAQRMIWVTFRKEGTQVSLVALRIPS